MERTGDYEIKEGRTNRNNSKYKWLIKVYLKPGKEESLKRFHPWYSPTIQRIEGEPRRRDSGCVHFKERIYSLRAFPDRKYCRARVSLAEGEIDQNSGSINWKWAYDLRRSLGLAGNPANNTYRLVHGEGITCRV